MSWSWDCVDVSFGSWHIAIYPKPRVWGLDFHKNAPCCKWWLLIGPFEINRVWTDTDTYPEEFLE